MLVRRGGKDLKSLSHSISAKRAAKSVWLFGEERQRCHQRASASASEEVMRKKRVAVGNVFRLCGPGVNGASVLHCAAIYRCIVCTVHSV